MKSRAVAAILLAGLLVGPAFGRPAADALANLTSYFETAASVISRIAYRVDSDPGVMSSLDSRDLEAITQDLARLSVSQTDLSDEINEYARSAQNCHGVSEAAEWQRIRQKARAIEQSLPRLTARIKASASLAALLTPEENMALRDNTGLKAMLLSRLDDMDAPCDAFALRQLSLMGKSYKKLVDELVAFRKAIARRATH